MANSADAPAAPPRLDVQSARQTLRDLWPFIAPYKGRIVAAFFALVGSTGATLTVPLSVRMVIDRGFTGEDGVPLGGVFLGLIAVVSILAVMSALRFYLVTWLGERVVADLRSAVFKRIMRFDLSFHDRARAGELVSRLTSDATQMKSAVGSSVSVALRNFFMFVGASIMMVVTSPALSGAVLIAIPFIVLPLIVFGRQVRARSRVAQDVLADASAMASEAISSVRTVQAHTAQGRLAGAFARAVEASFEAARHSIIARALLTSFAIFVIFSSVVLVLWYGANAVVAGDMTAGELGQFLLYAVFAAGALGEVSQVVGEVAQAVGAADRLCGLLKVDVKILPNDQDGASKPVTPVAGDIGHVVFDHVSFRYGDLGGSNTSQPVLRDVSFEALPGKTVALVGPSGAGKSTVLQLLMRFYDAESGDVLVDGKKVAAIDPVALRQKMALVPQDVAIFAASVRDNVAFARPDASEDDIQAALAAANASAFVYGMPDGINTMLGERGVNLSGGQRQRIAIARAVLQDAPILLLDEATSALDAESEHLVQDALERLMVGRTVIVIAHRLATVRSADQIVVLDEGKVVERGTHAELAASNGLYARLADLQFSDVPEKAVERV
ncbi:MAG: ATP-binding cassette domain-containing protein [Rhizobiales bacterium]|nr:ATP-binding cassette domain-containing protein [Hyphomicrobiales bacterium]MBO6700220.1 ATP-binding cassette domain-containing protein [Hyphomicrobiales bacterium]MBO6737615.1 ATP-binding cassette domain-containing protein [Hyphomicrobiales bacterium]MBO6913328.1 ATP-binding cassette domain-containing protein [Hyphomicrobiales bacterium]MBO6955876.1 ATP-binding cassette domain-containing protein [Hyphomicrobiales bacterium]